MILNMLADRIIIRVTCISPILSTPFFALCSNLNHFDAESLDLLSMEQSNNKTRRPSVCKNEAFTSIHHRKQKSRSTQSEA